jgi:hypothetical protein
LHSVRHALAGRSDSRPVRTECHPREVLEGGRVGRDDLPPGGVGGRGNDQVVGSARFPL